MDKLRDFLYKDESEPDYEGKLNHFPSREFVDRHNKFIEYYREELDSYYPKEIKEAIQTYLYTGYVNFDVNDKILTEPLQKFSQKINLKYDDIRDVIPALVDKLNELKNIVEPLEQDTIVYFGPYENVVGLNLATNKFIVSDRTNFHPLSGSNGEKINRFSHYKQGEEPRDYIIRNLSFMEGTTNMDWAIRYRALRQGKNYDTLIALIVPKGTPVILNISKGYAGYFDYQSQKSLGRLILFPGTTFVIYDTVFIKYSILDKAEKIYYGAICPELKIYPFLKSRIKRLYINENFSISDYSRDFDEQADRARTFFYHQEKSYDKNVIYAFPQITSKTIIPEKFRGKSIKDINAELRIDIINGREKYWTNQQLSYMRKELFSQAIFNEIKSRFDRDEKIHIVDATGNIGGDSLLFALQPEVSWVLTYEMNSDTFKLLENNIQLYGLHNIVPINEKFQATEQKIFRGAKMSNTVVIIDPPYEYPSGAENDRFVYSIDKLPLIYMIKDCLDAGAEMIVVTVPLDFTFSRDFAIENNISVDCFVMGKKDMKIYIAYKSRKPKFYSGFIRMPAPNK